MTRERISETLSQLEQKTNVVQIVKDHPWPALAVAVGAGVLLSGSSADLKAAAATATATRGASSKMGTVLDDVVANLMGGLSLAFQGKIEGLVNELKEAIGAPPSPASGGGDSGASKSKGFADRAPGSGGMSASGMSVSGTSNIGSASAAAHGDDTSAGMHAGWGGGTGAAGAAVSAAGSQGSPAATLGAGSGQPTRAD